MSARDDDTETTILAIVPAHPGWVATWRDASGTETFNVACWALVEYKWRGGSVRDVVAMTPGGNGAGLALATESAFIGLRFAGGPADAK